MDRDVFGLRDHPAGLVEQGATRIHPLLDVGRIGASFQRNAHFLWDEREPSPQDFEVRGIHRGTSTSRRPNRLTVRCPAGGTTMVAWSSATMAGPLISPPTPRRARSWTGASCHPSSNRTRRTCGRDSLGGGGRGRRIGRGRRTTRRTVTTSIASLREAYP